MKLEDEEEKRRRLEAYLDRGCGECHLRQTRIGECVQTALLHFDGDRYQMHGWVVMPNHVHALFTQFVPLGGIIESWKRFTAVQANRLLGRNGAFWQEDYFDTFMRDEAQFQRARRYTEDNPIKAKLVRTAREWPWSSARRGTAP